MKVINEHYILIAVYVVDIHIVKSCIHYSALFTELHDCIELVLDCLGLLKSHL